MINKVGIVGLGLIGGSLALELRSQGITIFGVSRQEITCKVALEKEIVDEASVNLSLLADTEIVFVCTPLGVITSAVKHLIPHLKPDAIITDVGSVKTPIVQECSQLWENFVGGHPMAGTAEQGIEAAQKGLFIKAPYVITPTETTPKIAVEKVVEIVKSLDSTLYSCTPEIHDHAVAWISHLPVMISASLIEACRHESDLEVLQLAQQLASSGFRDTSRVGGGNPELGVMMAKYNQKALLHSLSLYRQSLDEFIEYIEKEDWEILEELLQSTQQGRNQFL